jgi:segregation and condensation protein B
MKLSLSAQIEAILFFKTDALSVKKLAEILKVSITEIEVSLRQLELELSLRGVSITRIEDEVMLATSNEMGPLIEKMSKEELEGEMSKASVETLSIIMYKDGASKSEIDYIRGVNSNFILRALQIRGLVERKPNPKDARGFIYIPTFDLYNYLGITKKEELPDYEKFIKELEQISNGEKEVEEKPTE